MTDGRVVQGVVVAMAGLLGCPGCFLRTETITIGRLGSVEIEAIFEGSPKDFETLDAIPKSDGKWAMVRSVQLEDGKEKQTLKGSRRFEPGELLPASFAGSSYPDADLALDFPTTLRVEDRADGRYFIFHRRYAPRPWAFIEHWKSVYFDDDVKAISDKPVTELTGDQRRTIIQAFASVEANKQLEYAAVALAEVLPAVRLEDRLAARQALLSVYRKYDFLAGDQTAVGFAESLLAPVDESTDGPGDHLDQLMALCDGSAAPDECYDVQANRLFDEAYATYVDTLRAAARLSLGEIERFARAYERAATRHAITDQLGGHQFQIIVSMPGTIVAHNADGLEKGKGDHVGETAAVWRFDGTAFRDRVHELVVVSRVELGEIDGQRESKNVRDR